MLRAMWPSVNNIRKRVHLPKPRPLIQMSQPTTYRLLLGSLRVISCASSSSGSSPFPQYGSQSTKCERPSEEFHAKTLTSIFSRHLFTVKAIIVPIAGITFFIWCIVKAHGVGPIIRQPGTLHGSALGWAMVSSIMSCISNMATLVTYVAIYHLSTTHALRIPYRNAPDFASRARYPSAAGLPQLLSVPLGFSIVSFFGVIVSSSSQAIYGEAVWSPIDLLDRFLDGSPSHATRFGVWFISASFIIAQVRLRSALTHCASVVVIELTPPHAAGDEHLCQLYQCRLRSDCTSTSFHC